MTTYTPLQLLQLPPSALEPAPVPTALTVDPYSDILWVGSSSGLVTSLCSPLSLTRNVQFPAHGAQPVGGYMGHAVSMAVKEIRVTNRDVWTLTDGGLGGRKRGGAVKWSVNDPTRSLASMAPNPINSNEVIGGGNGLMLANTSTGQIVRRVELPSPVVHLTSQDRGVISASLSGSVSILDPRSGFRAGSSSVVQAHTGGLSGADVQTNLICTSGWTHSKGHPLPDPLVRIYDIRTLRPLPPVSFPAGPGFVRLHPSDSSKLVIASQQGMLQTYDMSQGSDSNVFSQLDVSSYVTSMALSNYGDYLTFGDADGQLHIWTTHDIGDDVRDGSGRLKLPPFHFDGGVEVEWPDQTEPSKPFSAEDRTPLNTIGMPNHREEQLLSNFANEDMVTVTSPFFNPPDPKPIPASVLASMKMVDFVGYASLPKELRGQRNVVKAGPGAAKRMGGKYARRESAPRFRSDKDRDKADIAAEMDETVNGMPKFYRKVEIKYSKFGVEDFDFDFYNHTDFSGLETDILNSYTNALLQALHYTSPIRAVAKAHICVDCTKEHCLLCEAGFLFRMLEDAKGVNCQASNFSRAFSATPQASALGLMDDKERSTSPYGSLIQSFNRWLMSTFSAEAVVDGESFDIRPSSLDNLSLAAPSAIEQVLGIETTTTNTCMNCGFVATRNTTLNTVDLSYPKKSGDASSFPETMVSSILRESTTRANCSKCKQFAPLDTRRTLARGTLPPVISLNALVASPETFEIWKDKRTARYLPSSIKLQANSDGSIDVGSGDEYNVQAIVVQIQSSPELPAHLVSFAKVQDTWIMFNDFVVREVSEEEVFSFPDTWKTPAIVILERADCETALDLAKLPTGLNPEVLYKDVSLAWNRRTHLVKHTPLTPEELPQPGTLIAIDAEFVALQQEEMEFRSDGTKSVLRPSHMSLARVSVLRENEVPFIDDYILTSETVVDYLTEFSGIKNGDLDRNNSPHTLVPLKVAYKKLRLLVDLGCVFIGHGLSKDFRTINIYVPPSQVLDTVNLYTSEDHKRKLSLRFLSWFLLKKDIQTASHDSIEDARYALLLYKLWEDFKRDERLSDVMDDIFFEGHKLGFKPPIDRETLMAQTPPVAPKRASNSNQSGASTPTRTSRHHGQTRSRRKP